MSILVIVLKILFGWTIISILAGLMIGKTISYNRPLHMREWDDEAEMRHNRKQ